jgi:predicted transposase YbfD/YdcC
VVAGTPRDDVATRAVSRVVEVEHGHGRLEARTYSQTSVPGWLHGRLEGNGLKTIGAVVRVGEQNAGETSATRCMIGRFRRQGERFARDVRVHWRIAYSLQGSLDTTCPEADSRVRHRVFAQNLAGLRRLALRLVKQHPGKQRPVMKRPMAAWSPEFSRCNCLSQQEVGVRRPCAGPGKLLDFSIVHELYSAPLR